MKRFTDATSEVLRALRASFVALELVFEEIRSRSWASVTFSGARHELCFRVSGDGAAEAADRFIHHLEAREFDLRGHIMADMALVSEERPDGADWVRISVEALTVEDC
ncbi:MAG TPA: hypothetical protein VF662_00360 [Allosphingosinicella sp.]|jgi:hypothetical protein